MKEKERQESENKTTIKNEVTSQKLPNCIRTLFDQILSFIR